MEVEDERGRGAEKASRRFRLDALSPGPPAYRCGGIESSLAVWIARARDYEVLTGAWLRCGTIGSVAYRVDYSPVVRRHMRFLARNQQIAVLDRVGELLSQAPTEPTRNRKKLRPDALAPWELRIGAIRVFYEVYTEPEPVVVVLAVGLKEHNVLRIGGEVIEL
jgi:mRNA-degrading endonuclease RelE of RelBE toxin-antitoxin system